ncbi:SixA phosphatase family protein [Niabella hibiscisoli]|uniref:SixA phosphatase family protein n=1 Tax=Niabella hibiscisoli TaxID=1825928 RepID=UPI001F0ECB17|nr:phosphoglycerate mutase family protein [Niabella hibiscisoli]MCH5720132.1 histidine phosphatase family protein [Niabella hibiscisoli]
MKTRSHHFYLYAMSRFKTIARWLTVLLVIVVDQKDVAAQKDSITRVFIIRHAEKADEGSKDPSLSVIGKSRAAALAKILSKTKIDAIYSTPYKRTRETVAALSAQSGIPITDYNPMYMDTIASLVSGNRGKTLVFVGHSNTVPLILNRLTKTKEYKDLPETEFDNMWILSLKGTELVDLVHLAY